jgi:hypothetical protein
LSFGIICLAATCGALSGCAMFDVERWNLDRYRDDRAVDIDRRLSEERTIVPNPF